MRNLLLVLALLLAACATALKPPVSASSPASVSAEPARAPEPSLAPTPIPSPEPVPTPPPAAHTENLAIAGLLDGARADAASGRLSNAAAAIERALRIEPRNPRLWQELARVRLMQGDYAQAESTAARSNSWAGRDGDLRAENWRLIAQAREARGDNAGAKAAREAAERNK